MKKILNVAAAVMFLLAGYSAYAQSEDVIEYEPVHSTILPGDGRLKIEEKYDRNASVYLSGDDLVLTSKGCGVATAEFVLPVNPMQDYIIEFALKTNRIGKAGVFSVRIGNIVMANCRKQMNLAKGAEIIYENSRWKTPLCSTEDATIRIERRRKNVTVYINGQYVCETQVQETYDVMPGVLTLISKSGTAVLRSVRIDQGAETRLD